MLKYLAFLIFSLFFSATYSTEIDLPPVIQFHHVKNNAHNESYMTGCAAFNSAPELRPLFHNLRNRYQIKTVIETGTYQGASTAFFALAFPEVHTIDISPQFRGESQERLSSFANIQFHLGSSEKVLAHILPTLKDRFILFYLDAHWDEFWPLLDELEEINKTHHQRCIIVIDDIKVPGRNDIPFDAYKEKECSYEYVKEKIEKLFDAHSVHYLIPNNVNSRAKLMVIPR